MSQSVCVERRAIAFHQFGNVFLQELVLKTHHARLSIGRSRIASVHPHGKTRSRILSVRRLFLGMRRDSREQSNVIGSALIFAIMDPDLREQSKTT